MARLSPSLQRAPLDTELSFGLPAGKPSFVEQTLFEALEFVCVSDPLDAVGVEGLPGAGMQATLVELGRHGRRCTLRAGHRSVGVRPRA